MEGGGTGEGEKESVQRGEGAHRLAPEMLQVLLCVFTYFPRTLFTLPECSCISLCLPSLAPDPAGLGALCPPPLAWPHPFVRHQHLKMSNCFQPFRPRPAPSSPSLFSVPVAAARVQTSSVALGTGEGRLFFHPNICLHKQLCAPGTPLLAQPGEEVLCLFGGVGFLASASWGWPWGWMAAALDAGSPGHVASFTLRHPRISALLC